MLQIKRIYEERDPADGYRILVDRLWPRGVSKEKADLDLWEKEMAPSAPLRKQFHHGEISYEQFMDAYDKEIEDNPDFPSFADLVREKLAAGNVTLLYGSKDETHNNAEVLEEMLRRRLHQAGS